MVDYLVFDGDGDGIPAAAIYQPMGQEFVGVTNQQKNERELVSKLLEHNQPKTGDRVAVFDISAEQNSEGLEKLIKNGAEVDFFDHHTRDKNAIPQGVNSMYKPDDRQTCTASITYDYMKSQGNLENPQLDKRATQFAIIGFANDGKSSASENFGSDKITQEERTELIKYAKAINYGSGAGKLDGILLLEQFVNSDNPIEVLRNSEQVNNLFKERSDVIKYVVDNSVVKEKNLLKFYEFPSKTLDDREKSIMAYNETLNSYMEEEPNKIHIGYVLKENGDITLSFRSDEGKARDVAEYVSQKLSDGKVFGRETAAGFGLKDNQSPDLVYNTIVEGLYKNEF